MKTPNFPQWLPENVKEYISEELTIDRNRRINIWPAFCDDRAKDVWVKLSKVSTEAAYAYAKCIVHAEDNYRLSIDVVKNARQDRDTLIAAKKSTINFQKNIRRRLKSSDWNKPIAERFESVIAEIDQAIAFVEPITKSLHPTFSAYARLTRNRFDPTSKAMFFIRSLSDAVREFNHKSLNAEIATTVGLLFDKIITQDAVKKIVGPHHKRG